MPKMKTHKASKKRFKVTATGKVKHRSCNTGHLMSTKNGRRCRKLRKANYLRGRLAIVVRDALGGGKFARKTKPAANAEVQSD